MKTQTTENTTHTPGQPLGLINHVDRTVTVYNVITGVELYNASPDLIAAAPETKRQLDIMISRANTDAVAWKRDDAIRADLLAALKTVLRDGCGGWDTMVRAAIARAEGR